MKAEGKIVKNTGTIGGSVNMPYKKLEYTGAETETAKVTVDNGTRTITVDGKYEAGNNVTIIGNIISATGEVTRERLNEVRAELERQINNKQNKLFQGTHIQIDEDGTISVVGVASEEELEAAITEINNALEAIGLRLDATDAAITTINGTIDNINNTLDTLDTKVDNIDDKLNENVLFENGSKISYSGDTVTLTFSNKNLKSGISGDNSEVIELANPTTAGLMTYEDYNTLRDLVDRVNALEGTKVRIAYTTGSDPTADQIKAFVNEYFAERGKPSPTDEDYNSVSVVVDSTKHIWNYYANNQAYKDDGLDTVSTAENDTWDPATETWVDGTEGIIKGRPADGYVFVESGGTGSVYGWSDLKTRVSNIESKNDTQDQEITALQNNKLDTTVFEQRISALTSSIATDLAAKQDKITPENKLSSGLISGLASVATTGDYNDLSNTPSIPSLDGYATEAWVLAKNYVTGSTLENYATKIYVGSAISDLSSIYSPIGHTHSEYATTESLNSAVSNINSTISSLNYLSVGALSAATYIPDITGLASETYVNNSISALSSVYAPIGNYVTNSDLSSAISGLSSIYASQSWVTAQNYASQSDIADLVNEDDFAEALSNKQDTLIAGENIIIDGNTISATGGGGGDLDYATEDDIYEAMGIINLDDEDISNHEIILGNDDTVEENTVILDSNLNNL